jgi:hypothetical protein
MRLYQTKMTCQWPDTKKENTFENVKTDNKDQKTTYIKAIDDWIKVINTHTSEKIRKKQTVKEEVRKIQTTEKTQDNLMQCMSNKRSYTSFSFFFFFFMFFEESEEIWIDLSSLNPSSIPSQCLYHLSTLHCLQFELMSFKTNSMNSRTQNNCWQWFHRCCGSWNSFNKVCKGVDCTESAAEQVKMNEKGRTDRKGEKNREDKREDWRFWVDWIG